MSEKQEKQVSGYFEESAVLMWCPECDEPVYRRAGADYEERLCKECFEEQEQEQEKNNG